MKNTLIFCIYFLFMDFALATTTVDLKEAQKNISEVLKPYQSAPFTQLKVEKKIVYGLTEKQKSFQGILFVAPGRVRWEQTQPEKNLVVFDGTTVWNETQTDPELPVVVTKSKVSSKNQDQVIFLKMLTDPKWSDSFDLKKAEKISDKETSYKLDPKKKISAVYKNFEITIENRDKNLPLVRHLSFEDDIGNTTKIIVETTVFSKKKPQNLFNYTPPKDAQVSEL